MLRTAFGQFLVSLLAACGPLVVSDLSPPVLGPEKSPRLSKRIDGGDSAGHWSTSTTLGSN